MNKSKDINISSHSNNVTTELKDSTNTMNIITESKTIITLTKQQSQTIMNVNSEITSVIETKTEINELPKKSTKSTAKSAKTQSKSTTTTKRKTTRTNQLKKLHNISHHSLNYSSLNSSNPNIKSNRKITDYFQIRKSSRKCKSDIEKEKRQAIEQSIKTMTEEGLEIRHIENKGRGIFATKKFYRGDFVCEYAGEMISYQAAKNREEAYAQDPSIGCYMYFFEYKSKGYCIDATAESDRLGRLLNHSKLGGNCHTKLFEINSKPYLILVASRDIEPGEEMTYDYGDRNKISLESHPWLAE
jgi:SET domain-containing protein